MNLLQVLIADMYDMEFSHNKLWTETPIAELIAMAEDTRYHTFECPQIYQALPTNIRNIIYPIIVKNSTRSLSFHLMLNNTCIISNTEIQAFKYLSDIDCTNELNSAALDNTLNKYLKATLTFLYKHKIMFELSGILRNDIKVFLTELYLRDIVNM